MLVGFITSFALVLLTLLDARRGVLFAEYPVRTFVLVLSPWHLPMLVLGIAGMFACHRALRRRDAQSPGAARYLNAVVLTILALLVVDLFAYRGVPAARSIASGRLTADWLGAFGATGWWRPFAQATSFLLNVWHATMLGILLSGLALTVLPVYLTPYVTRDGFTGSLFGAMFALPQPFCSCCSSVMAPSFVRRGASTTFLLSFVIGAPMLNVTTMLLALALLPAPFAMTRIVAGIVITLLVTYLVARVADRWDGTARSTNDGASSASGWIQRVGGFYLSLFDLDRIIGHRRLETPSQLIGAWLYASGRIALVLVPTLWVWSVIASALFQALPSAFGNNLASVVLAAVVGTFFMISTWSEIPMALQLIQSGYTGPAAALLVVLPAISLPCMMLLGGALQRFRVVALLSIGVMMVGIAAGALFL
jgi:uncharacterized membrane protein YraQ (UPF0718 family)